MGSNLQSARSNQTSPLLNPPNENGLRLKTPSSKENTPKNQNIKQNSNKFEQSIETVLNEEPRENAGQAQGGSE